jgi:hypothetical protein
VSWNLGVQNKELSGIRIICFVEEAIVGHIPCLSKIHVVEETLPDLQMTNRMLWQIRGREEEIKLRTHFITPINRQYQRRACLYVGKRLIKNIMASKRTHGQ